MPIKPVFNDDNLVLYMPLDEVSGNPLDYSGEGNDGTNNGSTIVKIPNGKRARSFNGTDNYVEISDSPELRPQNLTLSVWLKPTGTHLNSGRIIEKTWNAGVAPTFASYIFRWGNEAAGDEDDNGKIYFDIGYSGGTSKVFTTTNDFNDKWTHVVGTYDGGNIKIYVNGILENTTALSNNIVYTAHPLYLGRYGGAIPLFYEGDMSDVILWNKALSAEEIKQNYTKTYRR